MNLVNERIQHFVFGEGVVISQEKSKLSIRFSEQYGIKQFLYPDAFEKYLKLYNGDLQTSMLEELQSLLEAKRLQKRQEEEAEANRLMELERSKPVTGKKKSALKSKISKSKSKINSSDLEALT